MKINLIAIYLLTISLKASASTVSNEQNLKYKTQVAFLESGISLEQCNDIRERLELDSKSCELVSSQYKSFEGRAKRLVDSVPKIYRNKEDRFYIMSISNLIKAFPDTTDKEVLDSMMNIRNCKQTSDNII